jgi:hypothetical protein
MYVADAISLLLTFLKHSIIPHDHSPNQSYRYQSCPRSGIFTISHTSVHANRYLILISLTHNTLLRMMIVSFLIHTRLFFMVYFRYPGQINTQNHHSGRHAPPSPTQKPNGIHYIHQIVLFHFLPQYHFG